MDFRCLATKTQPMPSKANREKRVYTGKSIVAEEGPVTNELHQDEK